MSAEPVPTAITLHQKSRVLEIAFTDGRSFRLNTGIYSWEYLYELGENQETLWNDYLARLKEAGKGRD